jgi:surface carbohydrate biosynthesis protein
MVGLKKILYLPIETKSREFDSKLLIALASLRKDTAVVLSSNRFKLSKSEMPPGVVLLKSAARYEIDYINELKSNGTKCCVMDEEGLVHTSNEQEHSLRFSQVTLDAVHKIFFNGNAEKQLMDKFYSIPNDKAVITGNPRFDFYKAGFSHYYSGEAAQLKKQYGRYILIPSRFAMVNIATSDKSDDAYINFIKKFYVKTEQEFDIFRGMLKHGKNIFDAFLALLPSLSAALPDVTIIIRPHPSESKSKWQEAIVGLDNVKLIEKGPIGPWLLGAETVLHNGCTTGLEAFLMGKTVFSYMPYVSEEFDLKLPNQVSVRFNNESDLINAIKSSVYKTNQSDIWQHETEEALSYAEKFLANSAPAKNAYMNVSGELVNVLSDLAPADVDGLGQPISKRINNYLKKRIGLILLFLNSYNISIPKNYDYFVYSYKKNPGFSTREIKNNLRKLARVTGIDAKQISVQKLDEDLFVIHQN